MRAAEVGFAAEAASAGFAPAPLQPLPFPKSRCTVCCGRINSACFKRNLQMTSFKERLRQKISEIAERDADPLRGIVETTVRGMQAISTHALLDLIGLPIDTPNARRIALTMRSLGF